MEPIVYLPIGVLRTPFRQVAGMPIQPRSRAAADGTAVIDTVFAEGLDGLAEFSHVILLYHLHRQHSVQLRVRPFLDPQPRGVFATRAPARPNPLGLSVVPLLRVEGSTLHLASLDMLDETPLLDVKPYVPAWDRIEGATSGWVVAQLDIAGTCSDERFAGAGTGDR